MHCKPWLPSWAWLQACLRTQSSLRTCARPSLSTTVTGNTSLRYYTKLSRIGKQIEVVTAKEGRGDREVPKCPGEHNMFSSLDVSHWSPWMCRDFEMTFGDMLLSFFRLPKEAKLGNLFNTLRMVTCHAGWYHRVWDCSDGSIQGWFPTLDNMMHDFEKLKIKSRKLWSSRWFGFEIKCVK